MQSTNPKPAKKSQSAPITDNPVEQVRGIGRSIGKTVVQDLMGGMASDALASLFGTPKPATKGDMQPGQAVELPKVNTQAQSDEMPWPPRMPWLPERFPNFPGRARRMEQKPAFNPEIMRQLKEQELLVQRKIDEIRMEIKQLISEVKTVDKEIQQAASNEYVDPGEYHLNFLDRLKTALNLMLVEMKTSSTWLQTHKSKKKRMGYWAQYKKKGTTFGLSHERNVATQVG